MSHLAVFESWSGFLAASHSSHLLSIFCPDQNLPAAQRVVAVLFVGGLFGVKEGLVQLAPGFGDWGYSRIQGSSLVLFGESRPNCLSSHFSLSSTLEVSTLPVPRRATESNWAPFLQHPSTPPPPQPPYLQLVCFWPNAFHHLNILFCDRNSCLFFFCSRYGQDTAGYLITAFK